MYQINNNLKPKNNNKYYFLIIAILVIAIVFVQFKIFNSSDAKENNEIAQNNENNADNSGKVLGANDENKQIDLSLPDIKTMEIQKIPVKKDTYYEPNIQSKAYLLYDDRTHTILTEKNSDIPVPIASTTKIMTAIIALENYNLDDLVEISPNAASQIGSEIYLRKGDKYTVNDLLYALLVQSGNDAAMALAEHMNPDNWHDFINKMNEKAEYLGMLKTEYKDPAGLDDSGHSTARDLAIISSYALKNKIFKEIIKTENYSFQSRINNILHEVKTSNRLIKQDEPLYYPYALGIKTGFTYDAGHCLVSASDKNGVLLIGIILNTFQNTNDASAKESKKLLEWGYDNYNF